MKEWDYFNVTQKATLESLAMGANAATEYVAGLDRRFALLSTPQTKEVVVTKSDITTFRACGRAAAQSRVNLHGLTKKLTPLFDKCHLAVDTMGHIFLSVNSSNELLTDTKWKMLCNMAKAYDLMLQEIRTMTGAMHLQTSIISAHIFTRATVFEDVFGFPYEIDPLS